MAFVEFRDVRKVYAMGEVEVAAVDGMTFSIERGEFVVVVGPSGAGKTTLLNMLGGMDVPTSGSILLDGRDVSGFSAKEQPYYRRYDIGFVFQFYNLVQNLTALENVELASQICKDPLRPPTCCGRWGWGIGWTTSPRSFRRRTAARGHRPRACEEPQAAAADEPTGALDYQTGKAILKLLQDTCRSAGKTCVLITHTPPSRPLPTGWCASARAARRAWRRTPAPCRRRSGVVGGGGRAGHRRARRRMARRAQGAARRRNADGAG